MRKLILHMITSIDGFIADEEDNVNPATQWDEEMQSFYLETFKAADITVFGRRLYEQYVGHWAQVAAGAIPPENDIERRWAQRLMAMKKVVLSTTLEDLTGNTTVLDGDIGAAIAAMKVKSGGDILLMCGPSLVAQLTNERLIDEYMLFMCPNALGRGVHLFRDIAEPVRLRFQRSRLFRGGVNLVYYTPHG